MLLKCCESDNEIYDLRFGIESERYFFKKQAFTSIVARLFV